ncbi:MAG: hypothetical protein K6G60_03155 [Lachnospiraceae bacterium]|nr:hypothetical protein [Lachnospiraceae bacterium]
MNTPKQNKGIKEFFRKFLVSLKRKPQIIPGTFLVIAFLFYSLNLTCMSDSLSMIQGKMMGFCEFVTMLFSILVFVCFLNSYPRRQKPHIGFIILTYAMLAAIIVADIVFRDRIWTAVTRIENPIPVQPYMSKAYSVLLTHIILLIVTAALNIAMPLYGKLLKKINTSVEVEGNEDMKAIDLSED